jgi:hypothetical protein
MSYFVLILDCTQATAEPSVCSLSCTVPGTSVHAYPYVPFARMSRTRVFHEYRLFYVY